MPHVSVIVPCFNSATWIESAVSSISRQTFRDIEILVYDDGSTDGSYDILCKIAQTDSRIEVIRGLTNKGIVHALNTLLSRAAGRYIARMDADDVALPQRITRQLQFVDQSGVDLCGTHLREFGAGLSRVVRWPSEEAALRASMLFQNSICHPTLLCKREVFDEFSYREECKLAEDYDLFVRAGQRFRIANLPEPLLRYRRHRQQSTVAKREAMETITRDIRYRALLAFGLDPSNEELNLHHAIRAPYSITRRQDLEGIERWLMKLLYATDDRKAREVVASQWLRASVRAAPLGRVMWQKYRSSPLRTQLHNNLLQEMDLGILASLKLDYRSPAFERLRWLGLS